MVYVTFTQALLKDNGTSFEGKTVTISGSGNVAIYACEKSNATWSKGCNYVRFKRIHLRSRGN